MLILGIIQGVTEFLPVSSSGHLVILQTLLGVTDPGPTVEVLLHTATLLAIIVYFKRFLVYEFGSLRNIRIDHPFSLVIIGTLPTVIAYVLFGERIELLFDSTRVVSLLLVLNGIILGLSLLKSEHRGKVTPFKAVIIGAGQAVSLIPGISRSGITITIALLFGIHPEDAFRFSFLLVIPSLVGAFILKVSKFSVIAMSGTTLLSFVLAFLFGLFALNILERVIITDKFHLFGVYTIVLGILMLLVM